MASPTRGLCPLDPRRRAAAVISAARRESPVVASQYRGLGRLALSQMPFSEQRQIGVWGLRPQRGQGRALAFLLRYLAYLSAYGAEPPGLTFPNTLRNIELTRQQSHPNQSHVTRN